jgi:rod shape-determining protein MreD
MIPRAPAGRLVAVMAAAAVVQFAVLSHLRVFGVAPDLFVLLAVLGGLVGGRRTGAATGFAAGVTADLLMSGLPFGLSALVFTVVGYAAGWYAAASVEHSVVGDVVVAAVGTALAAVLFTVAARFVAEASPLAGRLLPTAALMAIWSLLLAVPVRRALQWVWDAESKVSTWAR